MLKKWDKIKKIFKQFDGLATIGSANVISSAISGLFWIYVASLLGTELYGKISYLLAIVIIAGTVASLGAGPTLVVFTAKKIKLQSSVYTVGIISAVITAIVLFQQISDVGVSVYIVGFVIFTLAINELLGQRLYNVYRKYVLTQKILQVLLGLLFYYILGFNGLLLGIGLSFFPYVIRIYKGFHESEIKFSLLKQNSGFMFNSYVLELSRTFSGSLDKLIIMPLFSLALLGNYQLGIQFLAILSLLPSATFQYFLSQDASGNTNFKLKKIIIISSIPLTLSTIFLTPYIIPIIFPKFGESISIIQIISFAILPITINSVYSSRFLASEKTKIVLIGASIYLGIQIPAIIILGLQYGGNGIAFSLVLANVAEALFLISVTKYLDKKDWKNSNTQ